MSLVRLARQICDPKWCGDALFGAVNKACGVENHVTDKYSCLFSLIPDQPSEFNRLQDTIWSFDNPEEILLWSSSILWRLWDSLAGSSWQTDQQIRINKALHHNKSLDSLRCNASRSHSHPQPRPILMVRITHSLTSAYLTRVQTILIPNGLSLQTLSLTW